MRAMLRYFALSVEACQAAMLDKLPARAKAYKRQVKFLARHGSKVQFAVGVSSVSLAFGKAARALLLSRFSQSTARTKGLHVAA